jgi:hypothetical protein
MIRAVLDTNILVSALLRPQGLPGRVFLMTLAGTRAQLCVSGDIYAEYEEVIQRPKFIAACRSLSMHSARFGKMDFGSNLLRRFVPAPTPTTTFSWSVPRLLMPITL